MTINQRTDHTACVALGSNLPCGGNDPKATILAAIAALSEYTDDTISTSKFYATPAFPANSGPDFVNAAVKFQFSGESSDLMTILHQIEHRFGRVRQKRWAERSLDLDLLLFDDQIAPNAETFSYWQSLLPDQQTTLTPDRLILPHPRLQDRGFVLVPLADIYPNWIHPITKKTVIQMLDDLPAQNRVEIREINS